MSGLMPPRGGWPRNSTTIPEQIAAMSTESLMRLQTEIADELDRRYRKAFGKSPSSDSERSR